jgi:hypothetical protein
MHFLEGEKQKIFTAELFDIPWKICIDSYNLDYARIVDLKCMQNFDWTYSASVGKRVSFVEAWDYHLQMAVYQKIEQIATNIGKCDVFIVAVTKQDPPDKAIIKFDDATLHMQLQRVEDALPRILAVKNGKVEPHRCNKCEYCRSTKMLTPYDIKHFSEV